MVYIIEKNQFFCVYDGFVRIFDERGKKALTKQILYSHIIFSCCCILLFNVMLGKFHEKKKKYVLCIKTTRQIISGQLQTYIA